MKIPSDYKAGYEKARLVDRETADNYIADTTVGDPVMDAVVEELASLPQSQVNQFLRAGMDEDRDGMRNAPTLLEASAYDDAGISYRLPDHAHAERSGRW